MTIQSLREYGAKVDEGLQRCMNMEDFYIEMVELGLSDQRFETLGAALEAGDLDEAFKNVHAIKGVIGNLALTPLYDLICAMTEHLRAKENVDYRKLYDEIIKNRDAIIGLK